MTGVYTALIVIVLWLVTMTITAMILRYRRGMKPKTGIGVHWDKFRADITPTLLSQENDNPTEERN